MLIFVLLLLLCHILLNIFFHLIKKEKEELNKFRLICRMEGISSNIISYICQQLIDHYQLAQTLIK